MPKLIILYFIDNRSKQKKQWKYSWHFMFSAKGLKPVTKMLLKELHQDCHKFGQVSRWRRNISSSWDVNIKNQVCDISYYYLHFEIRVLKYISVLSRLLDIFIISQKSYQFLSIFILNGVYNNSHSREKEVAWATTNSTN